MFPGLRMFLLTISVELATCTISGLTYRDVLSFDPSSRFRTPGEDPCNPLYWYPKRIPEYCYQPPPPVPPPFSSKPPPPPPPPPPLPLPIPLPIPVNPPMFMPVPPYVLPPPAYPFPPAPSMQAGIIPGVPGLVSPGGGVNVLPFSDAYSDLLEKHKQKVIRIRLQKILDEYERYPRRFRRRKYHRRRIYSSDE